ncbi:hypothetical protein DKX38_015205 [Salix brachista]|uniref:Retroviral polymerase SH3-like domain-containing protein n=1 Tax=Salix brachista TaxID=2182728 RepID=A0A5N5L4T5_9ROSI|nr:hypothetical protein DKX38_015205 [Salix brachista]
MPAALGALNVDCIFFYELLSVLSQYILARLKAPDERSKLDVKTRQCIFLGYGLDEFGYRLYDPVEKKLVRSRDVVFMEDQTIHDIEKTEKMIPPDVPPRRSTRDRHPSTRYSVNEYVLLNDGGEPECYAEAMEDEHKSKWVDAMQDEMKSLSGEIVQRPPERQKRVEPQPQRANDRPRYNDNTLRKCLRGST